MWTVFTCTFMLSIWGTNFIAHWAYAEWISSLAEHKRRCLKLNISAELKTIFEILVTIRFRFLQKKYFKKFHACVPITNILWRSLPRHSNWHRLDSHLVSAPNSRSRRHEFESPVRQELGALTKSGKTLGVRSFYNIMAG